MNISWPWIASAWAASDKTGLVDLSVGVATPSNGDAIRLNPAALAGFQNKTFDLAAFSRGGGNPDIAGTLAAGLGNFGYGISIQKVADHFTSRAAFAGSTGGFSLGVSANSSAALPSFSPAFSFGMRQVIKGYSIALVVQDVGNIWRAWTFGFGIPAGQSLRFGVDFNFGSNSSSIGISNATVVGSGEFYLNQKISFQLMYGMEVMPSIGNSAGGLGAGLSVWLSKKAALYGIYHEQGYDTVLGLRFLM